MKTYHARREVDWDHAQTNLFISVREPGQEERPLDHLHYPDHPGGPLDWRSLKPPENLAKELLANCLGEDAVAAGLFFPLAQWINAHLGGEYDGWELTETQIREVVGMVEA